MKWETRALGDCVTLFNGRAYSQHELLDKGTPVIRIQNLNGGSSWYYSDLDLPSDKYCEADDLLFAWSASFGPYIWPGPKAIYHYHIWKVVPHAGTDRGFMFHLLQWITDSIRRSSHGMAMLHMTKEGMEAWPISLPPLPEQRRIAVRLREQLAEVEKARNALKTQLDAAESFNLRTVTATIEHIADGGCVEEELAAVATLARGRFSPRPRNDPRYYNGAHPFIQTGDVSKPDGIIRTHKQSLNDQGLAVSKKFTAGTLVISIAANIGAVGILDFDACMPDSLVGIQSLSGKAENRFLYYTLLARRAELQALAPQMAQANLSLALLSRFRIKVPSLERQREIVNCLDSLQTSLAASLATIRARLQAVEKLPAALLREAFSPTGQVSSFGGIQAKSKE